MNERNKKERARGSRAAKTLHAGNGSTKQYDRRNEPPLQNSADIHQSRWQQRLKAKKRLR